MNQKTIITGAVAIIVLYWLAKQQVSAAVTAVGDAVGSAYKPVHDASYNFGAGLYKFTHPGSTVNSTSGSGGSNGNTR